MAPKSTQASRMVKMRYEVALINLDIIYDISQKALSTENQRNEFKVRYSDLESVYHEFTSSFLEMQAVMDEDNASIVAENTEKYKAYNIKYYDIKRKYLELFPDSGRRSPDEFESVGAGSCESKHKRAFLPKVQLPKFSGKIEEFPSFFDLFESLVGKDNSLSNTEKLYYLLGSLSGEPKSLVQHLSVIGDNYSIALDLLKSRYKNKRLLADKILHNLLGTGNVNRNLLNLKNFLNTLLENTKALEKLEFPVAQWSYLLFFINFQKMDGYLKKLFEERHIEKELPDFQDLIKFLENEVRILESSGDNYSGRQNVPSARVHMVSQGNSTVECKCCKKGSHTLAKCEKFISMNPRARKEFVQENYLCFRCLNHHNIAQCTLSWSCFKCKSMKHHYLLHFDTPRQSTHDVPRGRTWDGGVAPRSVIPNADRIASQNTVANVTTNAARDDTNSSNTAGGGISGTTLTSYAQGSKFYQRAVLLSTAIVRVLDNWGQFREARVLLDGGSQTSFISEECASRLGLRRFRSGIMTFTGLSGSQVSGCNGGVYLTVAPRFMENPRLVFTATVLNKITHNLPNFSLPENLADYFSNLHLADDLFYVSRSVDILIGADVLGDIMLNGIIKINENLPTAVNTVFGYVLVGPVNFAVKHPVGDDAVCFSQTFFNKVNTDDILEKFWELEDIPDKVVADPKDSLCEKFFEETYQRDDTGRFIVRLPFLSNKSELGNSVPLAKKRFYAMERRLMSNDLLREKYMKFMQDYADMGHMSICDGKPDDYAPDGYFIPHHGIFKANSDKIRVVFDASAVTDNGLSINDILHAGPKLQLDVMEIICRFRLFKYVFTTDIRMMFRQIVVHEDDRKYQLIFWREAVDEPLQMYKLNTVTYGMKSSPYLAIRTLRQLAEESMSRYPAAAELLKKSVYMDDILGGADYFDDVKSLKADLTEVLLSGGFELSKWVSNNTRLLEDLPIENLEKPRVFDDAADAEFFKILGIEWDPNSDSFSYHTNLKEEKRCTKRTMLSSLARTFDPLGWVSPVVFQGKVLMQNLWRLQISWDEEPPADIIAEWSSIIQDLRNINKINIERFVFGQINKHCSLHGFSDASEAGYSAVVYLRTEGQDPCKVSLMMAKSRVAPARSKLTIPKLELQGAALLIRLIKYVYNAINGKVDIKRIVCWSDSTIVLSWLQISPHELQVFEGNRVSAIINCGLDITWRHLPSEYNPADVASRGCRASELINHKLWWGPPWLLNEEAWPENIMDKIKNIPGIRKRIAAAHVGTADFDDIFTRFSNLSKLQSVVAYCMRFVRNVKNVGGRLVGPLSVNERNTAMEQLVRMVQTVEFAVDIELLKRNKPCTTRLRRLLPFIDSKGLLRVGGRLKNSNLEFGAKHPLILPKNHNLTYLIVDQAHKIYCHVGPSALQAILQKQFWILSARQVIRSRVFKCIACFKARARSSEPIMADLPGDRVKATGVFHTVQTDYAGPFAIKSSRLRNAKILKAYLCVFVCSASKAVHLEVVSDLTTEAFLAALTRFTSRRGLPSIIRSDCGTNYIGTNRHLNEVQRFLARQEIQEHVINDASKRGIVWRFNAPSAPHFGGLFEAAVKSSKALLQRVVGEQVLTFEELTTVFTRVEAVLNSRPLCPLSDDPQNFEVLTPAHFLIGRSLLNVPEYNLEEISKTRLNRFKLVQALSQRFWRVWSDQYLHTLQNRNKWNVLSDTPKTGELVLIKEDNLPSLKWKLGRIAELLPGKDGVVRVVRVKTASGTLTRPVIKICKLPISQED